MLLAEKALKRVGLLIGRLSRPGAAVVTGTVGGAGRDGVGALTGVAMRWSARPGQWCQEGTTSLLSRRAGHERICGVASFCES